MIRIGVVLAAVALAGAAAAYWALHGEREPVPRDQPPAQVQEQGVVRFQKGSPQLTSLSIAAMPTAPVPVAEPLNGRVAYDESYTARVSAPIAGRVLELRAQIGDPVAAGA